VISEVWKQRWKICNYSKSCWKWYRVKKGGIFSRG